MYRLVVDTALDYFYLALLKNNEILSESYEKGSNNHSETLMPKLESILKENNISLRDIAEVYTGIGPGSYTGVRIAVVISKMIAAMNDIKLYSFSSLMSLSSSRDTESYAFIDSRRGNCYTGHFNYDENHILYRVSTDELVVINDYFKDIDESLIVKEGKPNPLTIINSKDTKLVTDPDNLSPNYLQLVEAERKRLEKNGNN